MLDIDTPHKTTPMDSITEDDIANYLLKNPDFFERHAEVLASVQLSSPHGQRAISLQERQAQLLRDKIRALETRSIDMVRHGHENVTLSDKMQGWTFGLLKTRNAAELPDVLVAHLKLCFSIPMAAIRLWSTDAQWQNLPCVATCSPVLQQWVQDLNHPQCGTISQTEVLSWLEMAHPFAGSGACIALRPEPGAPAFGLLVLASDDAQRFGADMGTDFLERLGELASAALLRLHTPKAHHD